MVAVGGGVQAYLARDVDGGEIDAYEEVVVIDLLAARTVLVSRIPTSSQEDADEPRAHHIVVAVVIVVPIVLAIVFKTL